MRSEEQGAKYESAAQKNMIERFERLGGEQDEKLDWVVWLNGHCFLIDDKGDVDEA